MNIYKEVTVQYGRKVDALPYIIEITRLILAALCMLAIPICGGFLMSSILAS
jgi:hypothetical protein